jgi:hypothetical protein
MLTLNVNVRARVSCDLTYEYRAAGPALRDWLKVASITCNYFSAKPICQRQNEGISQWNSKPDLITPSLLPECIVHILSDYHTYRANSLDGQGGSVLVRMLEKIVEDLA